MDAEPYTPTEGRICIDFCNAAVQRKGPSGERLTMEEADAAFDRWLAKVRTDAAREAMESLQAFAKECMDGKHGDLDHETFAGWHHTWAGAVQHRVTHYAGVAAEVEKST